MSQKNEISINITPADVAQINQLLTQLKTIIAPYIHPLTKEEVDGLAKVGDKTAAFLDKVKAYSASNPEFIPDKMMDVNEFMIDVEALNTILPILKIINQISDDLTDTAILCGNEAYLPALMYYGNVKFNASNGVASAKTIYDDLKKRFPGRPKKKTN